jgi:hypothetical protein
VVGDEQGRSPHDVPDARELVDAVQGYLADQLGPRLEGRDRWLARVAANALRIAGRELELGDEHAAAHRDRLDQLGCADDVALGVAIRAGEFDDRWDELGAALASTVLDKLAVANPDHRAPTLEPERFE